MSKPLGLDTREGRGGLRQYLPPIAPHCGKSRPDANHLFVGTTVR